MSLNNSEERVQLLRRYRVVLGLFIFALVISGVTAFPLLWEMDVLVSMLGLDNGNGSGVWVWGGFGAWIRTVHNGLREMYSVHPWIAYGTDWLAFAHIAIAIFFYGPWKDPVRNIWVLQAGLIACALIIPLALICGEVRGIPLGWRMIDCSFGVIGALPLWYGVRLTRRIEGLGLGSS
jgi:hypothetical protein